MPDSYSPGGTGQVEADMSHMVPAEGNDISVHLKTQMRRSSSESQLCKLVQFLLPRPYQPGNGLRRMRASGP